MTTATPDLPAVLSEAVDLVRDHVRAAVRAAEFRRLFRKAQAEIHIRGRAYNAGTVAALRASFPEYADMIPGNANLRTLELPADSAPECEYHDDGSAYCANCGGHPYERCNHDFECSECGNERSSCTECNLRDDCDHRWMCGECEQPVDLAGQVR